MDSLTVVRCGLPGSSRSHSVARIGLMGVHRVKEKVSVGSLNLVDLAGSGAAGRGIGAPRRNGEY